MRFNIFYLFWICVLINNFIYPQVTQQDDPFAGYNLPTILGLMKFENESGQINFSEILYQALRDNQHSKEKFIIYPYSALITIIPEIRKSKDINDRLVKSFRTKLALEFLITGTIIDSTHISFELIRTVDGQRFYKQILAGSNEKEIIDKIIQVLTTGTISVSPNADMILVEGGVFRMGFLQPVDSTSWIDLDEVPAHDVQVRNFYIDKYEVTVGAYKKFCEDSNKKMPEPPEWGWENNHPIVNISWEDANAYAQWMEKRLPTEVEWEFAARGGNKTGGFDYSGSNSFNDIAWFFPNSKNTAQPVGTKGGNELGIYDMSGNVWEWCESDYRPFEQTEIPKIKDYKYSKIIRGGSFKHDLRSLRVCNRSRYYQLSKADDIGFRCVKDVEK